jgi:HIV Tat-specific factor 1
MMDDRNYEYDGETYIHTDKDSGVKYRWNQGKNEWELLDAGTGTSNVEDKTSDTFKGPSSSPVKSTQDNDALSTANESDKNADASTPTGTYTYDGDTAIYTDPSDGTPYEWDKERNAWIPRVIMQFSCSSYSFKDVHTIH